MPKKILVVDDSITIQKVFSYTFKEEEFIVTSVGDPDLAVEKAKDLLPDLVVVALALPQKSGYETFREISRIPELKGVLGLALVTANETFNPEEAAQVGISDYLVKPFDTQTLTNKVRGIISRLDEGGESAEEPPQDFALPPMDEEPSLIRFTRSELADPPIPSKPSAPEPELSVDSVDAEDIQVIDKEHEAMEFEEIDTFSMEEEEAGDAGEAGDTGDAGEELETPAETVGEPEFVPLDAITDEVEDLSADGEEIEAIPEEEVMELEEIELVDEPEEEIPSESALSREIGKEVDDLVFDIVEDHGARSSHLEPADEEEPADLDLSALEEIPLAEEVEEQELGEDDEFVPVAELEAEEHGKDTGLGLPSEELESDQLEEVPEEIPYLEEVQEEMEAEELELDTMAVETSEEEPETVDVLEMGEDIEEIEEISRGLEEEVAQVTREDEVIELDQAPEGGTGVGEGGPRETLDMGSGPMLDMGLSEEAPRAPEDYRSPGGPVGAGFEAGDIARGDISQITASTIEKVVWEVVPDLAEKLVRDLVREKIERVAWEVIPDLAEQLIKEEIRRLEEAAEHEN